MSLLLDAGADLEITDALGNTPLHNAVLYYPSTYLTVDLLLSRGADVTVKNHEGRVAKSTFFLYVDGMKGSFN